mgnify:FL=1
MINNDIEKMPIKKSNFTCNICDFTCNKQSNYLCHLNTKKHLTSNMNKMNKYKYK